ncbi:type II toxin-antitoxin system RelE/ParE family toxin [Endothiovibrio diazotrophicus]
MSIVWTDDALDDLEEILVYYLREAGPATAAAVERRIVSGIVNLPPFPERVRESDRIPGAREVSVHGLPYIAFIRLLPSDVVVLNVVHAARKFPK